MKTPARPLIVDEQPQRHASEMRVRKDADVDATPTPEHHRATREADAAAAGEGYASHVSEIRRLYAEGEVDAALDLASMVNPSTMAFSLNAIPVVAVTPKEIVALPLDARSGFLLARVDGVSSLQTLLDVSAMPWGEAMSILEELLALGAVRLLPPPPVSDPTSLG